MPSSPIRFGVSFHAARPVAFGFGVRDQRPPPFFPFVEGNRTLGWCIFLAFGIRKFDFPSSNCRALFLNDQMTFSPSDLSAQPPPPMAVPGITPATVLARIACEEKKHTLPGSDPFPHFPRNHSTHVFCRVFFLFFFLVFFCFFISIP